MLFQSSCWSSPGRSPLPLAPAAPSLLSDSASSQAQGPDLSSWPCIYHQHTLPAGKASHLSQWLSSQLQHVLRNLLQYSDIIWENSTSKSKQINVLKCLSFRVPPPLPSYHSARKNFTAWKSPTFNSWMESSLLFWALHCYSHFPAHNQPDVFLSLYSYLGMITYQLVKINSSCNCSKITQVLVLQPQGLVSYNVL